MEFPRQAYLLPDYHDWYQKEHNQTSMLKDCVIGTVIGYDKDENRYNLKFDSISGSIPARFIIFRDEITKGVDIHHARI